MVLFLLLDFLGSYAKLSLGDGGRELCFQAKSRVLYYFAFGIAV